MNYAKSPAMLPDDKVISSLRTLLDSDLWSDESQFPLGPYAPQEAKDSFGIYGRDFAVTVSEHRLILVVRTENEDGLPRFTLTSDMSGSVVAALYSDLVATKDDRQTPPGKKPSNWARNICYETIAMLPDNQAQAATLQQAFDHRGRKVVTRNGRHWSEHERLEMPNSFGEFTIRTRESNGDGDVWIYDNGITEERPGYRFQQIQVRLVGNKNISIGVFAKDGRQTKATVLNRDNMNDDGPDGVIEEINALLRSSFAHRAEATATASSMLTLAGVKHVVIAAEAVAYSPDKPGAILEKPSSLSHEQNMAEMSRQSRIAENKQSKVYKLAGGRFSVTPSKPSDATEVADIPSDDSDLWHDGKPDLSVAGPVLSADSSSYKSISSRDEDKSRTQNWNTSKHGWSRVARWVDLGDLSFVPA